MESVDVETILSRQDNLLARAVIGKETCYAFFTKKFEFIRPSNEIEWNRATTTWLPRVSTETLPFDPFPQMKVVHNVLYAYYTKPRKHSRIVGRFFVKLVTGKKSHRVVYEPLSIPDALDKKAEFAALSK